MNVSDLLQDSPSQHRKRPSSSQHDPTPPSHSPPFPPHQPTAHAPPYPSSHPAPASSLYSPSPFTRHDPAPAHRRPAPGPPPPSGPQQPPPPSSQAQGSPIEPLTGPAMASLQHPSPPHVHHTPHGARGPPFVSRQGSAPLRPSHQPPSSQHIKSAMPGSDRSPVIQRPNPAGSASSPNVVAHSPRTHISPSGTLILDRRTADEQKARLAAQASSNGSSTKPPHQQDMELIRHATRDRDRDRVPHDRAYLPPGSQPATIGPGVGPQPGHDPSLHDRPLTSPHDRPVPSPHERERAQVQHVHRVSPLTRSGGPPPKGPIAAQQSPPGSGASMGQRMGISFHDRDREREREWVPPFPHDRAPPPHDRDRDRPLHGPPSSHSHSHPPPHHAQHRQSGPGPLLGQGQFHPHSVAEWDRNERENEYAYHSDVMRDRERDRQRLREREREREIISGSGVGPGPSSAQSQRDREMMDGPGIPQRERDLSLREREHITFRERERERDAVVHRERDRDRRTHSRVPSPHPHPHAPQHPSPHGLPHPAHAHGHPGMPLGPGGVSGPGMPPPGPHGMPMGIGPGVVPYPPHQHELARDRDRERERELRDFPPIGLTERDQLVWERGCEREREYRELIASADRDRERMDREKIERDRLERDRMDRERERVERERGAMGSVGMGGGMPHAERQPRERVDREREQRDRAIMDRERDRAPYERERDQHQRMALEREQHPRELQQRDLHREREREHAMAERDPGGNRMIDIPMSALDRERERERHPQHLPYDRERERHPLMEPHRHDVTDRERMDASEREREREKGRDRIEMMERDHEHDRDREQRESGGREKETASVLMAADSKNDGSNTIQYQDPTLATAGATEHEKRDKQPEAMDVDLSGSIDRERLNLPERERERLELRDRLELLEREQVELIERDRLGTLDMADRERLEMIDRERIEILGRERLETLERPSAAELAKARQEREKRPFVNLGVYVWPRTPFPYYFPEYIPTPVIEEGDKSEEGSGKAAESSASSPASSSIPTELRLTVIIPPAFLPPCRPLKFRLWGGGHPPPTPFLPPTAISPMSRRRVYTDDSNVIESAVHAGLLTWSGIARAKQEQRAVRAVLALVPTLSSASGAVRGPAGNSATGNLSSTVGINGTNVIVNGHVNGTASVPRTRTSTPMPSHVPSTSAVSNEPAQPGYAGGIWASRFIGGWGEAFYGDPSAGRSEQAGQVSGANEAEDDGRGCVSCGWGWGHDGSAFEVISVDVVERYAHVAPGLGRRNRAQRLAEYAQRRVDVLSLPPHPASPLGDVTNKRKRRRLNVDFEELKKAGAAESAVLADEVRMMEVRTISFGIVDPWKCKTGPGYKYDPLVLQCALFPHLHGTSIVGPPSKRRKLSARAEGNATDEKTGDTSCAVVLECPKETYLVTCADGENGSRRYTLSVFDPSGTPDSAAALIPTAATPIPSSNPTITPPAKPSLPSDPLSKSKALVTESRKGGEGNSPNSIPVLPSPPLQSTKPTISLRALCSNLVETNFLFEKDAIIVKRTRPPEENGEVKEEVMGSLDIEAKVKISVLRWRWFMDSY